MGVPVNGYERYTVDKRGRIYSLIFNRYNSGVEASKATGADHSHILECCNGKRYKTVGGFIWKFE